MTSLTQLKRKADYLTALAAVNIVIMHAFPACTQYPGDENNAVPRDRGIAGSR